MTAEVGGFIRRGGGHGPVWQRAREIAWLILTVVAGLGGLLGLGMLWVHLTSDPLVDVHAYYDAARRLNAGQPLYPAGADPTTPHFYLYPPLMAILMRPFAWLPFHVFALGWAAVVVASFVGILRRLGANRRAFVAVGLLGMPIGFCLAVGQAHIPLTLLLMIGQPWSIALAANIKLFPILAAVWWVGRRDYQALAALAGWMLILAAFQWIIEPNDSVAFFSSIGLDQVAGVANISPYAISPLLWLILVGAGGLGALFLAPTRWGWAAAVALATLASPRLLIYMLSGLLAAVHEPDPPRGGGASEQLPDLAEIYRSSVR